MAWLVHGKFWPQKRIYAEASWAEKWTEGARILTFFEPLDPAILDNLITEFPNYILLGVCTILQTH